jgi:hypothetical protein
VNVGPAALASSGSRLIRRATLGCSAGSDSARPASAASRSGCGGGVSVTTRAVTPVRFLQRPAGCYHAATESSRRDSASGGPCDWELSASVTPDGPKTLPHSPERDSAVSERDRVGDRTAQTGRAAAAHRDALPGTDVRGASLSTGLVGPRGRAAQRVGGRFPPDWVDFGLGPPRSGLRAGGSVAGFLAVRERLRSPGRTRTALPPPVRSGVLKPRGPDRARAAVPSARARGPARIGAASLGDGHPRRASPAARLRT